MLWPGESSRPLPQLRLHTRTLSLEGGPEHFLQPWKSRREPRQYYGRPRQRPLALAVECARHDRIGDLFRGENGLGEDEVRDVAEIVQDERSRDRSRRDDAG